MLIIPPPKNPRKHGRIIDDARPILPPVAPLTLVSAYYSPGDAVTLEFDRAIDISAIDVGEIVVTDGTYTFARFVGDAGATLDGVLAVVVPLAMGEGWGEAGVRLSVAANNGIVASADGAAWAGVSDVELPFG